jgi:acyl carrier protein
MQEILETFERILTETFGVPAGDVSADATFEALGLDSLDVVELTLVIEEELGVKIEDEELEDVRTVGDAAAKVEAKRTVTA